jgi:hypothetical protein
MRAVKVAINSSRRPTGASGGQSGARACWMHCLARSGTSIPAVLLEIMHLVAPVRSLLSVPFGEEAGPLHGAAPTGLNEGASYIAVNRTNGGRPSWPEEMRPYSRPTWPFVSSSSCPHRLQSYSTWWPARRRSAPSGRTMDGAGIPRTRRPPRPLAAGCCHTWSGPETGASISPGTCAVYEGCGHRRTADADVSFAASNGRVRDVESADPLTPCLDGTVQRCSLFFRELIRLAALSS